jgi:virginiamycin B lyase
VANWAALALRGGTHPSIWFATLLVAAILTLCLVLAARAEAFVYWADDTGTIGRANLDGTGVDRSFIADAGAMAVDAAHIYWANSDTLTIGRANLDGTGVAQSFITGANSFCGVAVDHEHVYWANFFGGTIGRANLNGTGVDQSFITGAFGPCGVAVHGAHIYWANSPVAVNVTFEGTIGRANLDGTGVDQSFITAGQPDGVAVDAAHVYWADRTAGIGRANLDGTGVDESFITRPDGASGVAVDTDHVYWGDANTGTIARANLDGTGVDESFIRAAAVAVALDALRSFSFGRVKKNKDKGTARLAVKVPGAGEVDLAESEAVKPKRKQGESAGKVRLPIKPRGEAKKRLNREGKAKVKAEVTYTPTGGDPTIVGNTDAETVKLIKR